jgi:hypothetical protein
MLFSTTQLVSASSGLKVDVFVRDADCVIGQTADITLATNRDFTELKSVIFIAPDTVSQFQYGKGEVAVGDSVFANVNINGQHVGEGTTVNGPHKTPDS